MHDTLQSKKPRKCRIVGCERLHQAHGLCSMHYYREKNGITDMRPDRMSGWGWQGRDWKQSQPICSVKGCDLPYYAKGFCRKHYSNELRMGNPLGLRKTLVKPICSVEGCPDFAKSLGFCAFHYNRHLNGIDLTRPKGNKGELNVQWKGGVSEYPKHYEMKKARKAVLEEADYKCALCGKEARQVHHKDGSKDNHAEENLIAVCNKCHGLFRRPTKTSKYIRKYGMSSEAIAKLLDLPAWKVVRLHKSGELSGVLAIHYAHGIFTPENPSTTPHTPAHQPSPTGAEIIQEVL